jgi:hypothetical protein
MINLFDRIYLRHDNMPVVGEGQKTLVISRKEFEIPYTDDKFSQKQAGIIGVFQRLTDADEAFGGRDGLLSMLRLTGAKVGIVGCRYTVAEFLVQFWKSIFSNYTVDSLYQLYKLTINNENLHSYRQRERSAIGTAPNAGEQLVEKLTREQFRSVYNGVGASEVYSTLEPSQIPLEYLLMGYLAGNLSDRTKKVFFGKVDKIVKQNIVGELVSARDDFFFETHNYYLLNTDGQEVMLDDPLEYIGNHPMLAWALDPLFENGREDEVLAKYSLQQLKGFFETYQELFRYTFDDYHAIEFIQNKAYGALINFDIADQKGNFFCSSAFVSKINGLMISYTYQLKRLGHIDMLQMFKLKHV